MGRRRWLTLIVHPRDVAAAATRAAVYRAVTSGAVDLLQLRATDGDSFREVTDAARELKALLASTRAGATSTAWPVALVINHASPDVAAETGADGWHMKEQQLLSLPREALAGVCEKVRHDGMRIGCSVHSVEAAMRAAQCNVDYLQIGTMFVTASHPEKRLPDDVEGPELLQAVRRDVGSGGRGMLLPPLIAVGGIYTQEHVTRVLDAGADGVAVIRGVLTAADPHAAARAYREWLDAAPARD